MEPRTLFPGLGDAVARRTILRPFDHPTESWADVARRVADGNASLHPSGAADRDAMERHTNAMTMLWSGRHLQHGDSGQAERPQSVFTNCATSPTSFMLFAYLLAGSGVGRAYDDALCLADWTQLPLLMVTLDSGHPDFAEAQRCLPDSHFEASRNMMLNRHVYAEDSREGWAQLVELLEVAAFTGEYVDEIWELDFSRVRPRGSPIGGMQSRPASGPVPLMGAIVRIFEMLLENPDMPRWEQALRIDHELAATVAVGGARRAARMATKHWKDPDIVKFATIKKDGGLWSSNNSIAVDDEFWAELADEGSRASGLFSIVMHAQYNDGSGEPGLINVSALDRDRARDDASFNTLRADTLIDRAQYPWADETLPYLEQTLRAIKAQSYRYITNPCVTGETPILTRDGFRPIAECVDTPVEVWNGFEWSSVTPRVTGYDQPVLRLTFSNGRELTCTPAHRFHAVTDYMGETKVVMASELTLGDRLIKHEYPVISSGADIAEAYAQGFRAGDGMDDYKFMQVYDGKEMCIERMNATTVSEHSRYGRRRVVAPVVNAPKAFVPSVEWSVRSRLDWLAGLMDADGHVTKWGDVQISSINHDQLLAVQSMLMTLGAAPKLRVMHKAGRKLMPDGRGGQKEYECQACYRLLIGAVQMQSLVTLGLRCERLSLDFTPNRDASRFVTVDAIEDAGVAETVYCFTEPKRHLGCFNGIVTGQCGEIPLSMAGGVCVIGDLVPFHTDSVEEFKEAAVLMTRALIRVNLMRPGFRAEIERTNRIGVGLTGLHEYAAKQFDLSWHDLIAESELLLQPALLDCLSNDWPRAEIEKYLPHVLTYASWDFWATLYQVRLAVTEEARAYSQELGAVMPRTALTVKPAGSTSKLAALTEGAHLPAMACYLRWVQFQHGSSQITGYESLGYPVRHEIRDGGGRIVYPGVSIVGFPTKLPIADLLPDDKLVTATEATVEDQFDWLRLLEAYWLGDKYGAQVSYTLKWNRADVTYAEYVAVMREQLPTVRCVSVMTSDDWKLTEQLYGYSPEQPLTHAEYDALVAQITATQEAIELESLQCAGGACPI